MSDDNVKVIGKGYVINICTITSQDYFWHEKTSKFIWKKTFGIKYRIGLTIVNSTLFQIILGRNLINFSSYSEDKIAEMQND
jgi:hypothetical protein